MLLNAPINYLLLSYRLPPETVLMVTIGLAIVALIARLYIITPLIGLSADLFISHVVGRASIVAVIAGTIAALTQITGSASLLMLLVNLLTATIVTLITIWIFGLDKAERNNFSSLLKSLKSRIF
ncbi:hypothetical protein D3C85_1111810 [compost metagenome]